MASNKVNARIQMKRDTAANWTSKNPVLLNGERIIVDTASGEMRYKVGDGIKTFTELPFDDEIMREGINAAQATADTALEMVNEKLDEFQGAENADKLLGIDSDGYVTAVSKPVNATQSAHGLMSASDKTKLDNIEAGAQANQNAFSNIAIGSTTISADSASDTLTLASGSNVTISANANNDKITISAANTNTTYTLEKNGRNIVLTGSDGSSTSVTDSDTTYTLASFGVNASAEELNYSDGLTGNIQDQLDAKVSTSRTINGKALTADISLSASDVGADVGGSASNALASAKDYTDEHIANVQNPHHVTKAQIGLGSVENKSSATIRNELTSANVVAALGYTPPTKDTTYKPATSDAAGLMSAEDKTKLDGIVAGANKTTVDSSLSGTSVNPVQNKAVYAALTGKANTSHGNHVPAVTAPDGATFLQSDNTWAKVTPENIGAAVTAHTHSEYENQNAFSTVVANSKTISASSPSSTLTLVAGSNISIKPDTDSAKITISATDTTYTHPTSSGYKHIPAGGSSGQILRWSADGTAEWGADNDTTYTHATQNSDGLMSAEDKTVLGRIDDTYISLVPYGTPIPDNADLNAVEYLAVGNFYCSTSNGAASLTNCPTTHAFMMQVYSPLAQTIGDETTRAWNYRVRKLMTYQGVEYVQHVHSEGTAGVFTYDSWVKIVKAGDLATSTKTGLMRATDKAKLDGIEEGANKTVVDDTMSSTSANPVQNNVVNSAISNSASSTLSASKSYTDTAISNLINSAPTTLDTLGEIAAAMEENEDVVSALETAIGTKAATSDLSSHTGNKSNPHGVSLSQLGVTATAAELNIMDGVTATASEINKLDGLTVTTTELNALDGITSNIQAQLDGRSVNGHSHEMITVVGLRDALDGKAALEHGNHVPATETANNAKFLRNDNTWATVTPANIGAAASSHGTHVSFSTTAPKANGTAAAGSASTVARSDHVHPLQTSVTGSSGSCTGNAATATNVAWSGVTSKPSYYDAKAIKSITRSGTTFTWTCMDDTTGTFTQQDSNTTYSTMTGATSSAAGAKGLVPAPAAGKQSSFLRGDGTWATPTNTTYSTATSSTLGLVKIGYTTSGKNYAVQLSDGKMYVNVPWTDTNTTYSAATTSAAGLMSATDKSKLDAITASADSVSFSRSLTSGTKIGTITINGTGTDLYCETNTNTTYSQGTTSTLGLIRFGYGALSSRPSSASAGTIYLATS